MFPRGKCGVGCMRGLLSIRMMWAEDVTTRTTWESGKLYKTRKNFDTGRTEQNATEASEKNRALSPCVWVRFSRLWHVHPQPRRTFRVIKKQEKKQVIFLYNNVVVLLPGKQHQHTHLPRIHPPISVLDMTLNNLMVRFQWCWAFGEYRAPLHCHCSQVHSGPAW